MYSITIPDLHSPQKNRLIHDPDFTSRISIVYRKKYLLTNLLPPDLASPKTCDENEIVPAKII
jgi:hypothetical protein